MQQHVLVIDDDPSILSVLKRGLHYEGFTVDVAPSGHAGLQCARERPPDVVILDLMMPELDGFTVLERLRSADADLPVLLLTGKDAPADQIQGFTAGADDYVTKPFVFAVLVKRLQALLRRRQSEHSPTLHLGDLRLDTGTHEVTRQGVAIPLTAMEFRILHEFLLHPHHVLAKEVLLERIWGYDFGGNTNIVEVYVKQLRQKLEADGQPRLIQTVRNVGYVLREEA